MRRLSLLLVLCLIASLFSDSAQADTTGTLPDLSTVTSPGSPLRTPVSTALFNMDETPVGTNTLSNVRIGMNTAEEAAGLSPIVTAGTGLLYVAGGLSIGFTAYKMTTSLWNSINSDDADTSTVAGWRWHRSQYTGSPNAECAAAGLSSPCYLWDLWYSLSVHDPGSNGTFSGSAGFEYCVSASNSHCNSSSEDANVRALASSVGVPASSTCSAPCIGAGPQGYALWDSNGTFGFNQYQIFRTDSQMAPHIRTSPCNTSCQSGVTNFYDYSSTFTRPGSAGALTDTQLNAALCAIGAITGSGCGDHTTPANKAAIDTLKKAADPTYDWIEVLKPIPNETYTAYETRLTASGYLGSYTNVAESSAVDGYGPSAVTRVQFIPSGGSEQTLDPVSWPDPLPKINPSTSNVTVRYNTTDAIPVPTDSTVPTPTGCSTCAIDWTPIEGLAYGSKFPFGFFTWVGDFFGGIPTGGSCPTLSIGKPSAIGGGTQSISFCSTQWESWRPTVFLVLECFMTLWGIATLANKITGMGSSSSGDGEE